MSLSQKWFKNSFERLYIYGGVIIVIDLSYVPRISVCTFPPLFEPVELCGRSVLELPRRCASVGVAVCKTTHDRSCRSDRNERHNHRLATERTDIIIINYYYSKLLLIALFLQQRVARLRLKNWHDRTMYTCLN